MNHYRIEIDDTFADTEDVAVSLEWMAEKLRRGYQSGSEVAKWRLIKVDE